MRTSGLRCAAPLGGAPSRVPHERGSPDSASEIWEDLSRPVYGVFGVPVDSTDRDAGIRLIQQAAKRKRPFLLSTANLNFLIQSLEDEGFRESLLASNACTADGMPVVWLARLVGAPIRARVA